MDVFLHIPKSAGTTIRTIISREYGSRSVVYYEPETEHFEYRDAPQAYLRGRLDEGGIRLITGHLRYGIHEFLHAPCRYFTLLRDPVERALSEYFYAYAYPQHRYQAKILSGEMSFADFLDADTIFVGSTITHFLSGESPGLHTSAEVSLTNLRRSITAVGTSERFDESMLLIAKDFGWAPPLYLPRNVTRLDDRQAEHRMRVREEVGTLLRAKFALDYQVYDAANELMSHRILRLGGGFRDAAENFSELQSVIAASENPRAFDEYNLEQDDELPPEVQRLYDSRPYRALVEYLRSAPADAAGKSNYVGYFDGRARNYLSGWAMDLSRTTPIKVTLRRGERVMATVMCDIPRPDVAASGFPPTPCGFSFPLDPPVDDLSDFTVCFEDTLVRLGR